MLFSCISAVALLIVEELIESAFSGAVFTEAVLTEESFTEVLLIEEVFGETVFSAAVLTEAAFRPEVCTSVLGPTWSLSFAFLALSLSI